MDTNKFDEPEKEGLMIIAAILHKKKKRPQNRKNGFTKFWKSGPQFNQLNPDFSPPVYQVYQVYTVDTVRRPGFSK